MNEESEYGKKINYTNRTQIQNIGQCLNRYKRKWENRKLQIIKKNIKTNCRHEIDCARQQPGVKRCTFSHSCVTELNNNKRIHLGKGKVVLVLNQLSTRHEDLWGSGSIAPPFMTSVLDGGEWSASRPSCFTPGKDTPYPLDRKLGGPQSWYGHCGLKKISSPFQESNPDRPASSPTLNYVHKQNKSRLISGNGGYHSVKNLLCSCLLFKYVEFKVHEIYNFISILYGRVAWRFLP
jgi:hypothetical protein